MLDFAHGKTVQPSSALASLRRRTRKYILNLYFVNRQKRCPQKTARIYCVVNCSNYWHWFSLGALLKMELKSHTHRRFPSAHQICQWNLPSVPANWKHLTLFNRVMPVKLEHIWAESTSTLVYHSLTIVLAVACKTFKLKQPVIHRKAENTAEHTLQILVVHWYPAVLHKSRVQQKNISWQDFGNHISRAPQICTRPRAPSPHTGFAEHGCQSKHRWSKVLRQA